MAEDVDYGWFARTTETSPIEANTGGSWWERFLGAWAGYELTKQQMELEQQRYFAPPYQPVTSARNPNAWTGDPKNIGLGGQVQAATGIPFGALLLGAGLLIGVAMLVRR